MISRLTGTQVLAVLPSITGVESQAGDFKAVDIDADYTANLTASMTGRAFTWISNAITAAGLVAISLTAEQEIEANRIQSYRVILECYQNSRFADKSDCEVLENYEYKRNSIQNLLCIANSNLGTIDTENCFSMAAYIGAEIIQNCNHTHNGY